MNCWKGCIAKFVYPGPSYGAWLLCVRVAGSHDITPDVPGDLWWQTELLSASKVHIGEEHFAMGMPGAKCFSQDKYMRPIPPDELTDETARELFQTSEICTQE